LGGAGVALLSKQKSAKAASDRGLHLCVSCGSCKEQCPLSIDIRKDVFEARGECGEDALEEAQRAALSSMGNYGNPWMQPRSARAKWAKGLDLPSRGEVLFYPGCSQSLLRPEAARMTVQLLREAGISPAYLGSEEGCCGSLARKLGDDKSFKSMVTRTIGQFSKAGAKKVITSCPGCLVSLGIGKELAGVKDLEIIHVSQALSGLKNKKTPKGKKSMKVTYHDSCELGRSLGIYDPPREIIAAIPGVELIEMERSRENSACCGSGAGVRSGYPELSDAIARKRVAMASKTGASMLITSCPWCYENLSGINPQLPIKDLIEFIYEAYLGP